MYHQRGDTPGLFLSLLKALCLGTELFSGVLQVMLGLGCSAQCHVAAAAPKVLLK